MTYDFTKNDIIRVVQVVKSQVPPEFITALDFNITPEWRDTGGESYEHIYSIDEVGQQRYWENEAEMENWQPIIEALEKASGKLAAGYFQFVD